MVDFRFLGREGLMIEYTDIVSLVGYNIINYLKSKRISNEKIMGMSDEDILLSYLNRSDFDISKWIKDTFDLECNVSDYIESEIAYAPNNLYAYKMFTQSNKEKIKNLMIYSDTYSKVIEKYVSAFNIFHIMLWVICNFNMKCYISGIKFQNFFNIFFDIKYHQMNINWFI